MIVITSAAYITPALASEFGKLPPCMLPVQNKRLYEHQLALFPSGEKKVISLPKSYQITNFDKWSLECKGVSMVFVPDELSLGQSIVYVLNVMAHYDEPVKILHGDTLFSSIPDDIDICAISKVEDNYDWTYLQEKTVYSGYFAFSDQSLLIQKITECGYQFMDGVRQYQMIYKVNNVNFSGWMDFGLSNTYYRSISKMTTQRVFNAMRMSRYSVIKSSRDKRKMQAEANWFLSLPVEMKHYAPAVWSKGEDEENGYYEIEYYYLSSLANLFVFGQNKAFVWDEILSSCVEFLNAEFSFKPPTPQETVLHNDTLYGAKTQQRLEQYSVQSGVSLDATWRINGVSVPSLKEIIREMDKQISKGDMRFVSIMHGDPCFSNILYDFKSKSIKVIDPRGLDSDGNISIYGDIRYDVAKLAHSVIGLYDFIICGMYDYVELSPYEVKLRFESNEDIRQMQENFLNLKIGDYTLNDMNVYPIMVHLFLSMLPLHSDNPKRQKAMLANALRLYVELKDNKSR